MGQPSAFPLSDFGPRHAGRGEENGDAHGILRVLNTPFADKWKGAAGEKVWWEGTWEGQWGWGWGNTH